MNFRQMETLLAIVRLGSFAAAAGQLNATQSTISSRIKELESELGVQIFDRTQRRASLTSHGRELLGFAERAVDLASEIRQKVGSADTLTGLVRIGVAELVAVSWLPAFTELAHQRYPKISLEVDVALTINLTQRLSAGKLDLGLVPAEDLKGDFEFEDLGTAKFTWMASPKLTLPDGELSPEDLIASRIISLGSGSVYHGFIDKMVASSKRALSQGFVCNSMGTVAELTKSGQGVSLLPELCYHADIEAGRLIILQTSEIPPAVQFFAVYPKGVFNAPQRALAGLAAEVSSFQRSQAQQ